MRKEQPVPVKYYTFHQKQLGDYEYEVDQEVHTSRYVIIEAVNADDANERARKLGMVREARWPKVNEAMSDDTPSVFSEPVVVIEGMPDRFDIDSELDVPLVSIHYRDGHVETFTPRVRLVGEVQRGPRTHNLEAVESFGGWRQRVGCTVCGAEFTVPRGTHVGDLLIEGCIGVMGEHPTHMCECPEHDPL
jgi:hypothetical protein